MLPLNEVATFPSASCAATFTAGVMLALVVAVVGWTLKTSAVAAPGVTVNGALTTAPSPEAEAEIV